MIESCFLPVNVHERQRTVYGIRVKIWSRAAQRIGRNETSDLCIIISSPHHKLIGSVGAHAPASHESEKIVDRTGRNRRGLSIGNIRVSDIVCPRIVAYADRGTCTVIVVIPSYLT